MVGIVNFAKDVVATCWKHVKNFIFFIERVLWKSQRFLMRLVQSKK